MNLEKYTQNSIEALRSAVQYAVDNQNGQWDQQHLLYSLLSQKDGASSQLMKKLNIAPNRMLAACDREIQRIPKMSGYAMTPDRMAPSRFVYDALNEAERQAEYMKDDFVSVEHILLGLIELPNAAVAGIFGEFGVTKEAFLEALQKMRGNTRVTSQNPEDT